MTMISRLLAAAATAALLMLPASSQAQAFSDAQRGESHTKGRLPKPKCRAKGTRS